jgi:hypothetical protein
MVRESSEPIAAGRRPSDIEGADGGGPSRVSKDPRRTAARIAQKLKDAGVDCGIVNFVPTETAVLRRDRIVVCLMLIFLTALTWSYLLWLSADMHGRQHQWLPNNSVRSVPVRSLMSGTERKGYARGEIPRAYSARREPFNS